MLSDMKLVISVAMVALLGFVGDGEAFADFPMNDDEMFNCFYIILCKLRRPEEFRRLMNAAGPKLMVEALPWFRDISRMPDAADTDEFWAGYPDRKCAYSQEEKRDMFNRWLMKVGEWWADVCENRSKEECSRLNNASQEIVKIMNEYTASGDCSSKAVTGVAQKEVENMKPKAGPMMG